MIGSWAIGSRPSYILSYSEEQATRDIENSLNDCNKFLNNLGLEISPQKTKFVIIHNKCSNFRQLSCTPYDKINGHVIQTEEFVKFLGITLDFSLRRDKHIDYLVNRTKKTTQVIKAVRGAWWGSHP